MNWVGPFEAVIVVGRMQVLKSDEPERATANVRLIEGIRQVASYAETKGVRLVLEAVNRFEVNHNYSAAEVLEVVEVVDSPATQTSIDELLAGTGDVIYTVTLTGDTLTPYTQVQQHSWVSGIETSREGEETTWQVSVTDEAAAKDQLMNLLVASGLRDFQLQPQRTKPGRHFYQYR